VRNRRLLGALSGPQAIDVTAVALSSDGTMLASAGFDRLIQLWDVDQLQPIGEGLEGHDDTIEALAFIPDGRTLASGGGQGGALERGSVRLWDVRGRQPIGERLEGHESEVKSVSFSPDGDALASADYFGTVILWNPVFWGRESGSVRSRLCTLAGRNMSAAEWQEHLPQLPYRKTCEGWPEGKGVRALPERFVGDYRGFWTDQEQRLRLRAADDPLCKALSEEFSRPEGSCFTILPRYADPEFTGVGALQYVNGRIVLVFLDAGTSLPNDCDGETDAYSASGDGRTLRLAVRLRIANPDFTCTIDTFERIE
jgi:hypothetical protein